MSREHEVNYAANPYGFPPEARKRGFPWSLALTVVAILVFAGGVLWVVVSRGGEGFSGPPPLLTADPTPYKTRPAEGGADEAPQPDRLVYERLAGGTRPTVERLLPPPEQPMPRPIVVPTAPAAPEDTVRPTLLPPPVIPPPPDRATAEPVKPVAPPSANPPKEVATKPEPAKPASPPPQPVKEAAKPGPAPQPAMVGEGAGRWRIQLASVRTEAEAASEWKRIANRHPDILGGVAFQVAKADLGDRGVYYRVQGGGVDETRARAICDQLKSQNVGCVVVRP